MTWLRARDCESNACAEVLHLGDRVQIRSSLRPEAVVVLELAEWAGFIAGVKAGDFDPPYFRTLAEIQASVRRR